MRGEDVTYVDIGHVEVLRLSQKAMMISCEDADVDEQWVPLSVVDWEASEVEAEVGSTGSLHLAEWFAKKEGLV